MPWSVDESLPQAIFKKNKHIPVDTSAMKKYYEWRNEITSSNVDPGTAAKNLKNDCNFEGLQGKRKGIYSIRLSQEHRVVFEYDTTLHTVTVLSIGGHY
ncbi:MAG: hypothetical protein AAFN27_23115 [Pseudomonadota bacterium]